MLLERKPCTVILLFLLVKAIVFYLHFYCKYFEWEEDKVVEDKIIVSEELGIKIELSDFKDYIILEETFNPLINKYKNKFCTDELKPFNTSLQAMIEFHQSQNNFKS